MTMNDLFIIIVPFHLWSDYFKGACLDLRWPWESVRLPHCVNIQDKHTYLPLKRRKQTQIFMETGTVWLAWRAEGWRNFHFICVDTPGGVIEWGHRWNRRGLSGAHRPQPLYLPQPAECQAECRLSSVKTRLFLTRLSSHIYVFIYLLNHSNIF